MAEKRDLSDSDDEELELSHDGFGQKRAKIAATSDIFGSMSSDYQSTDGEDNRGDYQGDDRGCAPVTNDDDVPQYSTFSKKMMGMMGYKDGEGLGRFGQGRSEIVEASKQRGRRGLGFEIEGLEADDVEWKEGEEEVQVQETPDWLPSCKLKLPTVDDMTDWMVIGQKKNSISDETEFCHKEILQGVLSCKTVFDSLAEDEFLKARTRANPYETIKGAIFQNRAAMKMANMDAVFDFMFSCPRDNDQKEILGSTDLLYFADICSGPGGFSEYMLWRKKWWAKGFGFTIKGENDFKLEKFISGTPETFEPFYGVNGVDGDGDIMRSDNLEAFQKFVFDSTNGQGVHLVMGDGGFSVAGQENLQEVLTKRLVLCQFLCAMMILQKGGHFLCKTFDLFTPFTVGLVYLLYRAFDEVCVHKPVTSRPANSERYVICKGYREASDIWRYLFFVNEELGRLASTDKDILEVVPLEMIKSDAVFLEYMTKSNESMGRKQMNGLRKLRAYVQNLNLVGKDQDLVRKECLSYWKIPDIARAASRIATADIHFQTLLQSPKDRDQLAFSPTSFTRENMVDLKFLTKYKCFVSSGQRFFLIGLGRSRIFKYVTSPHGRDHWRKLEHTNFQMPRDTLIEVEIVEELRGEGKGQRRSVVIHVCDALILGGKDVRNRHYDHRMEYAAMFVKSINKLSRPDMVLAKTKKIFELSSFNEIFEKLEMRRIKGRSKPALCYMCDEYRAVVPNGITFFKHLNDPWSMAFSKSQQKHYYHNPETRASRYDMPSTAIATFGMCAKTRYFWSWRDLKDDLTSTDHELVTKDAMLDFIQSRCTTQS